MINITEKKSMFDFNYVDVKSGMVHFKNRIGIDDIITKRGKIWMVDYKNHIGDDDIITKRGESGMVDYFFRGSKP